MGGRDERLGKIVEGGALRLIVRLHRLLNLADEAGNGPAVIATKLLQRRHAAMPASGGAGSGIGGEIGEAIGRKDPGIDVRIAVVPEAGTIAQDRVVMHIENGEWPEQRADPAISAVVVAPPSIRVGAVAQAAERCNRDDLLARHRIGEPGLGGPVDALRSERSRSGVAATGMGARMAYPPDRQDAAYRHSRDADGIEANPHPGRRFSRQQGCQNKYGNAGKSNAPLRHGTLPRKPRRAIPGTSLGIDDAERNRKFHTERGIAPKTGNNQVAAVRFAAAGVVWR